MSSVEKFTTVEMKLSLMITPRIARQSVAFSPSNRQIDSKASLTAGGGLPIERTSTRCCFLMDCTAGEQIKVRVKLSCNGSCTTRNFEVVAVWRASPLSTTLKWQLKWGTECRKERPFTSPDKLKCVIGDRNNRWYKTNNAQTLITIEAISHKDQKKNRSVVIPQDYHWQRDFDSSLANCLVCFWRAITWTDPESSVKKEKKSLPILASWTAGSTFASSAITLVCFSLICFVCFW